MNILYVTSEAVPFCKTGGLADVAGSLPQSLAANGDRVSVILPLYQSVADAWRDRLHFERYTYVRLAWRSLYCGLFSYERQVPCRATSTSSARRSICRSAPRASCPSTSRAAALRR